MTRALVLGGGGITGIAWMLGLLTGLAERGVDLRVADDIVGTSAGSVVGAQVATGVDVEERYAAQLAPATGEVAATLHRGTLLRLGLAVLGSRGPWGMAAGGAGGVGQAQRVRARIGALALRTRTAMTEADRIAVIGSRLPVQEWPERRLRVTAVDARDGAFRVIERTSGIPLVTAVAASCAVPGVYPPVTANGTRLVDGGVRSPVNADLVAGADRVVVLAPIVRGIGPQVGAAPQVAELRAAGARVAVVSPDPAAVAAIGRNVLDPARRAGAARAGRAQAGSVTEGIRTVWDG